MQATVDPGWSWPMIANMASIEPGQKLEVYYDPIDPDKVELA